MKADDRGDSKTAEVDSTLDVIIRSLESGMNVNFNHVSKEGINSDVLTVKSSADSETRASLMDARGGRWRVYRDQKDNLVFAETTRAESAPYDEVETIEVRSRSN